MSIGKAVYEHLKTRKKYNTLQLTFNVLQEDYERKILEYNELKRQYIVLQQTWTEKLKEQEEEIIKLKKKVADVKKSVKEKKKD